MKYLGINFPVVSDWNIFEQLCCDLWSKQLGCTFILHGRKGQAQEGIDFYAYTEKSIIGLQCKLKTQPKNSSLTISEVNKEVEKAKNFSPSLTKLIIATSSPHDVKLQKHAREISKKHSQMGVFKVEIYGWDFINEALNKSEYLATKYYNTTLLNILHKSDELVERVIALSREVENSNIFPWLRGKSPAFRFVIPELFVKPRANLHKTFINKVSFEEWYGKIDFNQNIILISEPGHGKSTILRMLYLNKIKDYKNKISDVIPIFIDAKVLFSNGEDYLDNLFEQLRINTVSISHKENLRNIRVYVYLDALDEFYNSHKKLLLLLEQVKNFKISFIFTCRTKYFEDFLIQNDSFSKQLSEIIELLPWDVELEAIPFIDAFVEKVGLKIEARDWIELSGLSRNLLTTPFNAALTAILICNEVDSSIYKLRNSYELYQAFYSSYLNKEHHRNSSDLTKKSLMYYHTLLALEIFRKRSEDFSLNKTYLSDFFNETQIKKLSTSQAFHSILLLKQDVFKDQTVVLGFFHETIMEFLVARTLVTALCSESTFNLNELLSLNLTFDVNRFFRESIENLNKEQLSVCYDNLKKAYIENLPIDSTFKETNDINKYNNSIAKKTGEINSKRRGQIAYICGRLPGIDNNFICSVFHDDPNMMVKISAAISCLYKGIEKVEYEYISSLTAGSKFDLATRSLLLVYFGDTVGDTYTYVDDGAVDWSRTRNEIFLRLSQISERTISLRYWDIVVLTNFFKSRKRKTLLSEQEYTILKSCRIDFNEYFSALKIRRLNNSFEELLEEVNYEP